jgi:hypothetical protein
MAIGGAVPGRSGRPIPPPADHCVHGGMAAGRPYAHLSQAAAALCGKRSPPCHRAIRVRLLVSGGDTRNANARIEVVLTRALAITGGRRK